MKQPPLTVPASVSLAEAECKRLSNGIPLYTLHSDAFEVLRVTFVFAAGTVYQKHPFSASAAANLLSEGTRDFSAQEIAEQLDYYGSWFDINIDRDASYISFCTLSRFAEQTLRVAEQIILHPRYPEEEVASYCAKRRQLLAIERTKIDVQARELFGEALFGAEHPYGVHTDEAEYDHLTRQQIVDFYNDNYLAERCFVVCSGRVGAAEQAAVEAIAAQIPSRPAAAALRPLFPEPQPSRERFVRRDDAVQSSIRVGRLLFPRTHPDFVGMQVVATALGGYFGARLMQNLREEHGYTYGAMAAMVNFQQSGYLAIAAQVGCEVTDAALREIRYEIERLRHEPMPAEELEMVKNMMAGEMMRILDGPFGIADVTIENLMCGFDNQVIDKALGFIRRMTPADVQALAHKYLAPEDLITVIVGNRA